MLWVTNVMTDRAAARGPGRAREGISGGGERGARGDAEDDGGVLHAGVRARHPRENHRQPTGHNE